MLIYFSHKSNVTKDITYPGLNHRSSSVEKPIWIIFGSDMCFILVGIDNKKFSCTFKLKLFLWSRLRLGALKNSFESTTRSYHFSMWDIIFFASLSLLLTSVLICNQDVLVNNFPVASQNTDWLLEEIRVQCARCANWQCPWIWQRCALHDVLCQCCIHRAMI